MSVYEIATEITKCAIENGAIKFKAINIGFDEANTANTNAICDFYTKILKTINENMQ